MSKKKNNNNKKNWPLIIILTVLVVTIMGTAYIYNDNLTVTETTYPEATRYFYVEDYSHVLNEETERFILDEAVRLNEATKAQIVVVMAPNTQNSSLFDYSVNLANKWGIGDKDLDNGVLLFFVTDPEDPHVRMDVGKGLEGALPDGKAGRILDDYAVGPRDEGQWNKAAGDTFVATAKEVYAEYGVPEPDTLIPLEWDDSEAMADSSFADADFPDPVVKENEASFFEQILDAFLTFLVFAAIFAVVILICIISLLFGGGGGGGGHYSSGGHSGGGGGFHGGGGSFGGGGASR